MRMDGGGGRKEGRKGYVGVERRRRRGREGKGREEL